MQHQHGLHCEFERTPLEILVRDFSSGSRSQVILPQRMSLKTVPFLYFRTSVPLPIVQELRRRDFFSILEQMTRRDQLGTFELVVILVLIRLGDNAYGVPICEEIEKRTGRDVAIGSVYAALERLEAKGFVSSELGEPTAERGGRAKKYFQVTAKGLTEVRETQQSLMNLWRGLPELARDKA